jgi:acetyltransferase-like isoleucine patch superfamily enzyme
MSSLLGRAGFRLLTSWQRFRRKTYSLAVAGCFQEFGGRAVITPPLRLSNPEFISIGAEVFLGANCWLQTLPRNARTPRLAIGKGTRISGDCVLSAAEEIVIEPEVLMARNVYIADHRHAFTDRNKAVLKQGIEGIAPVRVKQGAWLGQNVVVLPGVTIGRGSVIGANSVVRADVPDWSVAVGAPAHVVRRFDGG